MKVTTDAPEYCCHVNDFRIRYYGFLLYATIFGYSLSVLKAIKRWR